MREFFGPDVHQGSPGRKVVLRPSLQKAKVAEGWDDLGSPVSFIRGCLHATITEPLLPGFHILSALLKSLGGPSVEIRHFPIYTI
jgi:hypothetical protein